MTGENAISLARSEENSWQRFHTRVREQFLCFLNLNPLSSHEKMAGKFVLALPLSRDEKTTNQSSQIKAHNSAAGLQFNSRAFGGPNCPRYRRRRTGAHL